MEPAHTLAICGNAATISSEQLDCNGCIASTGETNNGLHWSSRSEEKTERENGRLSRPGPAGISVRSLAYSWPTAQPSSHLASNLIERPRLLPMHTCPCGCGWLAQTCGVIIVLTYSSACFLFLTDVKV